jgi:hypothetical protein
LRRSKLGAQACDFAFRVFGALLFLLGALFGDLELLLDDRDLTLQRFSDHAVWCWGQMMPALGPNSSTPHSTSFRNTTVEISSNGGVTCALDADASLFCYANSCIGLDESTGCTQTWNGGQILPPQAPSAPAMGAWAVIVTGLALGGLGVWIDRRSVSGHPKTA